MSTVEATYRCNAWYRPVGQIPGEPPDQCELEKGHSGNHDHWLDKQSWDPGLDTHKEINDHGRD